MQIGMIGLGRMGANMVRRLIRGGHTCVVHDASAAAVQTLAQVGHPVYEVPLGATIPAYYALVASRYMHEHGTSEADLAELAVLMRRHALMHPGAQFRETISAQDVLASKPIAAPLKLLDCCPVSDGGAAFVVVHALMRPVSCSLPFFFGVSCSRYQSSA